MHDGAARIIEWMKSTRWGHDFKNPAITEVPFGGRMVCVDAPMSQQFELRGEGIASALSIDWLPKGREAFEIEVRARIMGNSGAIENFPEIRWFTEAGAGNAVWSEPFETRADTTQNIKGFAIPGRGMVWRAGARRFRISFFNAGNTDGGALEAATVQITFLPVFSGLVDTYPYADSKAVQTGEVAAFPMTAREWRLQTAAGQPVAPAAATVAFVGVNGAGFVGGDASLYAEWQPIPFLASGWGSGDAGLFAAYR